MGNSQILLNTRIFLTDLIIQVCSKLGKEPVLILLKHLLILQQAWWAKKISMSKKDFSTALKPQ